jgi:hypothetical protein
MHNKWGRTGYLVLLGLILLFGASFYGIYYANFAAFNPIKIPPEYNDISNILAKENGLNKVVYYPMYGGPTEWSKGHGIGKFDMKSSSMPTYFTSQNEIGDMLALPYSEPISEDITLIAFRTPSFYEYLAAVGVKYIVFHDDRTKELDKKLDEQNLEYILDSDKAELRYSKSGWYLFELNTEPSAPVSIPDTSIIATNQSGNIARFAKADLAIINSSETETGQHFADVSLPFKVNKNLPKDSANYDAFKLDNNYFNNWHRNNSPSELNLSLDEVSQTENILTIDNNNGNGKSLLSFPVNVTEDDTLFFTFQMKAENVSGADVELDAYFQNEGKWVKIDSVVSGITGNREWNEHWSIIDASQNMSMLRYVINSGVPSDSSGPSRIWIKSPDLINLHGDDVGYDNNILGYSKISPYKWLVRVNASSPYLLTFTEVFDSGWTASVQGREIKSTLVNGMMNGFYIDNMGTYDVLLEYRPQRNFEIGFLITGITIVALSLFIVRYPLLKALRVAHKKVLRVAYKKD